MTKKRRAKGEGSVYKDNQGYWNGQLIVGYTADGKPKYKKFRSKKQGIIIEKMNTFKLGNGTASQSVIEQSTFDSLLDSYLETVKKVSVRPTSYDSILITAEQVKSRMGFVYINDLTAEIIQVNLINKMMDENYAYSTIHKAYVLVNECLNYAVIKDYIVKNPCMAVKLPNKENFDKKEIRFLNDEEIQLFKDRAMSQRKTIKMPIYEYGNILCLIIYTGLRVGELCAIKWQDIDFTNKTLVINKTIVVVYDRSGNNKQRKLIEQSTTKSGKSRVIPLNNKAIEILNRQKALCGGDDSCYIVNGSVNLPDKTVIANSYSTIAKSAGIEHHAGVHTLRHTFASLAIRKGVDIKIVSEILGHASTAFTYNTYVHIMDEQKAQAVDLLNDI